MNKVYIIGTGPGSKEYIIPLAAKIVRNADILIGSPRLLSLFPDVKISKISLKGNYAKTVQYILRNRHKKLIAVLVSGDPGLFSFTQSITCRLKQDEFEIIPGISSLQTAFSRIGMTWHDVCIMNLHNHSKRGLLDAVKKHKKVFLFTDDKNTPSKICSYLFQNGLKKRSVSLFFNLSYPNERIIHTNINTLQKNNTEEPGLCVMLIKK